MLSASKLSGSVRDKETSAAKSTGLDRRAASSCKRQEERKGSGGKGNRRKTVTMKDGGGILLLVFGILEEHTTKASKRILNYRDGLEAEKEGLTCHLGVNFTLSC